MVGGIVIETIDLPEQDRVWVNVQGTGCEPNDTCAIYVERTAAARSVSPGDGIWWQLGFAHWTPRAEGESYAFHDKPLKRVGYSGVPRPLTKEGV